MKQKRFLSIIAIMSLLTGFFMASCIGDPDKGPSLDKEFLIGKWQNGTDNQVYKVDGTGYTWDTADDVTEEEAQAFTWTLEVDILTHIHIFEIKACGTRSLPKTYKVTKLTEKELSYEDEITGKIYTFKKI